MSAPEGNSRRPFITQQRHPVGDRRPPGLGGARGGVVVGVVGVGVLLLLPALVPGAGPFPRTPPSGMGGSWKPRDLGEATLWNKMDRLGRQAGSRQRVLTNQRMGVEERDGEEAALDGSPLVAGLLPTLPFPPFRVVREERHRPEALLALREELPEPFRCLCVGIRGAPPLRGKTRRARTPLLSGPPVAKV